MKLFVGTYTDLGGPGIWVGDLTGDKFTQETSLRDADNPNYLLLSQNKKTLFAVCGNGKNGFFVLSYDLSGNDPRLVSKQKVSGVDPCHLVLSSDERYLITANYGDGSVSVFPVNGQTIEKECQFIRHAGKSINPARQEGPHAHHVSFAPNDKTCLSVVDLGLDQVVNYRLLDEGRLIPEGAIQIPAGNGPRHLVYAKGGERKYVVNELISGISFIEGDTVVKTLSTLPEASTTDSHCAAIRISEDDNRLYASNRGHDSIAVFDLPEDGIPVLRRHIPSHGMFPRDFAVLPEGKFIVANQNEGGLVLLNKDGELLSRIDLPGAVSVTY